MALDIKTILAFAGVPKEQAEACMEWAFGPTWHIAQGFEMDELWNSRHGDLFTLTGNEIMDEALARIGRVYIKHHAISEASL